MSAITDWAAKVKTVLDAQGVALDAAVDSLTNIAADEAAQTKLIQDLKDQIAAGGSTLTPEDQAALDELLASATAKSDKTKALADSLKATADSIPDPPPPPPNQG